MYIRIALAILLLWGVGCTQDSKLLGTANPQAIGSAAPATDAAGRPEQLPRTRSFANLPDHGNLVAYPTRPEVRHDGAYTWHRAGLSEEHALRAVGGVMKVTTPLGEQLEFEYERHVEHASGDWTWIGRAMNGAASDEMVVTFGERAAFGTISQPGRAPLKLTMSGGTSWLVETDRSMIAGIDNPATRPRGPDFLIPPKITSGLGASAESSTASVGSSSTASASAAAAATVDVLLGYTSGFATAQGGASQAVTRLNNMVEIANQTYVNSQVDARIRLVHAMQVSYPDNTSNGSALEALTGFRAPSTQTTPDPAFAALRAARDQYGADLVSLVRQFNTPENDGCGIAWLIGGGQTGIDSTDEYFGYSVVSDGRDAGTDGKTYFCRDETLAHELGHNMGSQHDRATATVDGVLKYGVYPYSFGYKTAAAAGNFYTVMAYGDSGQTSYRAFTNPRITYCGGNPCGLVDSADNARSLGQTMPLVSAFRAAIVPTAPPPVRGDVDANGMSDLLWRDAANTGFGYWAMNGPNASRIWSSPVGTPWSVLYSGDLTGDSKLDVLWTDNNQVWLWVGDGVGFTSVFIQPYPVGWKVVGGGDINGDGKIDLIWRNTEATSVGYWLMNGAQVTATWTAAVGPQWRILQTADMTGDGLTDIVWTDNSQVWLWVGNGATFVSAFVEPYPTGWTAVGAGDINGDGKADLIWRDTSATSLGYWLLDGARVATKKVLAASAEWRVAQTGDMTGDGKMDIVWTNDIQLWLWVGDGTKFTSVFIAEHPPGWKIISGGS